MGQTELSNDRATTCVPEAPNVTLYKQPTSSTWGRDISHITGQGEGRNSTTGSRNTITSTSREITPERSASPSQTSQDNATTGVLAFMRKAIESLVNRRDRHDMDSQCNICVTQTRASLQTPAQTYTFGSKEVSLQEFLKLKSLKFTGTYSSANPQSFLDGTYKDL